ncbi:NFACT RNA binding domain-containing protein [Echinicola jeungdonensis]|uniref:NFACT RNA binding domain-containing protein n=1 Tax=Echinicola jeungdonensis TaxID=709343 RepID=A0ABV5J5N7_9BACT|nr:NFACT RNA binding domain-containing protein [Echinicola jeungdonensis]MDN3670076.1 NFACT RNA binding domain-containing protein [Echinicola jeungdonensis]
MHLNYHFFKFLCPALQRELVGFQLLECFSQNKDELIMGFAREGKSQYIRANLSPSNPCISFPEEYARSKKNSVDLFPEAKGEVVQSFEVLPFERAFTLQFESGALFLFKLHGNRSNILLFPQKEAFPSGLFRGELQDDHSLTLSSLFKDLSITKERFVELEGNASKFLPTLGKIPRTWLKDKGYIAADLENKWTLMQEMLDMLSSPLFSICREKGQYYLSLLPEENPIFTTENPIEACNEYFKFAIVHHAFDQEKHQIQKQLEEQKKKTHAYLKKTTQKLLSLQKGKPLNQIADIIMANLHQIPKRAEKVTLFDFYENKEIVIKLKDGVSPQKQAENLYRKSKNRKIEEQQLLNNISEKETHFLELEELLEELNEIKDFKTLRQFAKTNGLGPKHKEKEERIPFKRFEFDGFEILVGKSAKANDEMLRYYSWKDDLWLHAKDVSGSHVIIKYKSGLTFPKTTIERAAEMAAYYSKNKNETLAPVIYTPCKYVRKVKGSPAGAVMVDKEKVVMVPPKGPE